ncbi:MAG: hypothetical protein EXS00_04000 [Phycisphaerales bacterium]|nr:hypothetical protein [Phycisphaerales bacterium]
MTTAEVDVYAKVLAIIISLGVMASSVLVLRQQRYELFREVSKAHWRTVAQRQDMWSLRARIASLVGPERIRIALPKDASKWEPIPHRLGDKPKPSHTRMAFDPTLPIGPRQAFGG